jgi:hypothetical protein
VSHLQDKGKTLLVWCFDSLKIYSNFTKKNNLCSAMSHHTEAPITFLILKVGL